MISLPFRRNRHNPTIDALYGMIVAQARSEAFYRDYGAPDTIASRLDMIILHLVLVLRRLAGEPMEVARVGQQLFDRFCRDIDDNFREMGVGDLAVPKEMRRVAEAFYGRSKAYGSALASEDNSDLANAVERNVFGSAASALGASRLATYIREAAAYLGTQEAAAIVRGELKFPDPERVEPHRLKA